jgi:hypothetical protein
MLMCVRSVILCCLQTEPIAMLLTARAIRELTPEEAARDVPVRLTGAGRSLRGADDRPAFARRRSAR